MANKVTIGILILLVVLIGVLGAYSYTLNQQVNVIGRQLIAFQEEQSSQINALTNIMASQREEAAAKTNALQNQVATLENKLGENASKLARLEDELKANVTAQSGLDANRIYQQASKSIVRVTNGENIIGSGFMLDTHVVTAYHVVEQQPEIYVVLPDG